MIVAEQARIKDQVCTSALLTFCTMMVLHMEFGFKIHVSESGSRVYIIAL